MIYVRINKTGSTSITNLIQEHCTILQVNELGKRVDRLCGWLSRENIKQEFCFTVVRNPFTRAVSCWGHCLNLVDENGKKFDYDFQTWLLKDFTEMQPAERSHSLRQVDFLFDKENSIAWVDEIFRLEDPNLEHKIKSLTGATGQLGRMALGDYDKEKNYYNSWTIELVKAKYWLDFKLLGYSQNEIPNLAK